MTEGRIQDRRIDAAGADAAAHLLLAGIVFGSTLVLGSLSRLFLLEPGQFAPIGLPNPALLAFLLTNRRSKWWWVVGGGFGGELVAGLAAGVTPVVVCALALCSAAQCIACATLLFRRMGRTPDLSEISNIGRYVLIAGTVCLGAALLAGLFELALTGAPLWHNVLVWATREFTGMATLTPCLYILVRYRSNWRILIGLNAWPLALLLAVLALVFLQDRMPMSFLVVAALLLVTWRLRILGAAIGVLATLIIAVAGTMSGVGPFAIIPAPTTERLLALQLFLTMCFHLTVPVAAQMARARRMKGELEQALAAARDSEARYRVIADNMHDIVLRFDADHRIVYASPSCRVLGYAPEELIGQPASAFVHPDEAGRMEANNDVSVLNGAPDPSRNRRHRVRLKDGSYRWYEGSPSPIHDDAGGYLGSINIVRDVHEQQVAAEALAESEARFRMLADNMRDVVVRTDVQGVMTYVSPSCRTIGFTPEELIGRPGSDFIHPDEVQRMWDNLAQIVSGLQDDSRDRRYRIRRKDGRYAWFEGSPSADMDASGRIVGVVNIFRDIDERHAAAEALSASEARYRLLADNMNDLVACSGRDGFLTFMSGATRQILGYEPSEMIGRDATLFVHPDDLEPTREQFRQSLRAGPGGPAFRVEYRAFRKDGSMVWLEAHPRAFFDADGEFVEFQDVVRDISAHKALEARLRSAQTEADAANVAKADFLADMSHELRGPLNLVTGFARLARTRPGLREPVRTYVERIEEASRGLLGMVSDILDFSRLEAAQVVFRQQPVPAGAFARATLELMEAQARAKDLELVLKDNTPPDLVVALDHDRIRQVLLNFLGNAVKFTHAGRVTLEMDYEEPGERLRVKVIDTGPGVPAERLARLFKRFSQVGDPTGRGYDGAGLGLAISKGIVEGVGGEIGVESEVGRGSTFWFAVPAPRTEAPSPAESDRNSQRIRVLVADADPAMRELVAESLAPIHAEVLRAGDADAALEIVAREPVDVIVLDLALPTINGRSTLRRVRGRRGPNMATPVLAFASASDPALHTQVMDDGFQGLIAKPCTPSELVSAIAHAVAMGAEAPSLPARRRAGAD